MSTATNAFIRAEIQSRFSNFIYYEVLPDGSVVNKPLPKYKFEGDVKGPNAPFRDVKKCANGEFDLGHRVPCVTLPIKEGTELFDQIEKYYEMINISYYAAYFAKVLKDCKVQMSPKWGEFLGFVSESCTVRNGDNEEEPKTRLIPVTTTGVHRDWVESMVDKNDQAFKIASDKYKTKLGSKTNLFIDNYKSAATLPKKGSPQQDARRTIWLTVNLMYTSPLPENKTRERGVDLGPELTSCKAWGVKIPELTQVTIDGVKRYVRSVDESNWVMKPNFKENRSGRDNNYFAGFVSFTIGGANNSPAQGDALQKPSPQPKGVAYKYPHEPSRASGISYDDFEVMDVPKGSFKNLSTKLDEYDDFEQAQSPNSAANAESSPPPRGAANDLKLEDPLAGRSSKAKRVSVNDDSRAASKEGSRKRVPVNQPGDMSDNDG